MKPEELIRQMELVARATPMFKAKNKETARVYICGVLSTLWALDYMTEEQYQAVSGEYYQLVEKHYTK